MRQFPSLHSPRVAPALPPVVQRVKLRPMAGAPKTPPRRRCLNEGGHKLDR
jgi:hypothetical protein